MSGGTEGAATVVCPMMDTFSQGTAGHTFSQRVASGVNCCCRGEGGLNDDKVALDCYAVEKFSL